VELDLSDDACAEIARLRQLDTLVISSCRISDAGWTKLSGLSGIQNLYLYSMPGSDHLIDTIHKFPQLRNLYLWSSGPALNDERLARLADVKQLALLDVSRTGVTGEGFQALSKLKLSTLQAGSCSIRDEGLAYIAQLQALTDLTLSDTKITDAGLDQLASLSKLKSLDVRGTAVTEAGAHKLQEKLPKCIILWNAGELLPK
jgi:hypothetical protein